MVFSKEKTILNLLERYKSRWGLSPPVGNKNDKKVIQNQV